MIVHGLKRIDYYFKISDFVYIETSASKMDISENEEKLKPKKLIGVRHYQFLLLFFTILVLFGIRTSLSVAIIEMTSKTPPDDSITTYPEWDNSDIILSSFFWGYVVPQIGAGQLSEYFGPKWFLVTTMIIGSLLNIAIPFMADALGSTGVIICRVIQGLCQGFLFPSVHSLISKWTPLFERARISNFVYGGSALGIAISMPITGEIAGSKVGWPVAFYAYGGLGLAWAVVFAIFVQNSPAVHKWISDEEKRYIESTNAASNDVKKKIPTPWKSILTSLPVWGILAAGIADMWGTFTLLTEIPSYLSNIMKFDIKSNGQISALPYVAQFVFGLIGSPLADMLVKKKILSITATRKLFNSLATFVPAAALICLAFIDNSQKVIATSLLVIAVGFRMFVFCGYMVNAIDIAPNHTGTVIGMVNGTSNIFSILGPLSVGLLGDDKTYPEWDNSDIILSSFFWGYVVPQIGAGQLSEYFGPKWFLFTTTIICSLANIAIPFMADALGSTGVIICRVIQGLCQGFLFPSVHSLISKWTPLFERSRISNFVYGGSALGIAISMPITGEIAGSKVGWPVAFYAYGGLGLAWAVVFAIFVQNSPAVHRWISEEEKRYIESTNAASNDVKKKIPTPWKSILTSLPVWGILAAGIAQCWGGFTLLTEIPSYMSNIMEFDIKSNGQLSALPYVAQFILGLIGSPLADMLVKKELLSMTATRKLFNSLATFVPAAALICLAFIDNSQKVLATTLLVIAVGFTMFVFCGYMVNAIDIAPNHTGTIIGMVNGTSNIFSILGPLSVGLLGDDKKDPILWRKVFLIAAGIWIACGLFYDIFATANLQSWNNEEESQKQKTNKGQEISIIGKNYKDEL